MSSHGKETLIVGTEGALGNNQELYFSGRREVNVGIGIRFHTKR